MWAYLCKQAFTLTTLGTFPGCSPRVVNLIAIYPTTISNLFRLSEGIESEDADSSWDGQPITG
jgi:hypothetical protein